MNLEWDPHIGWATVASIASSCISLLSLLAAIIIIPLLINRNTSKRQSTYAQICSSIDIILERINWLDETIESISAEKTVSENVFKRIMKNNQYVSNLLKNVIDHSEKDLKTQCSLVDEFFDSKFKVLFGVQILPNAESFPSEGIMMAINALLETRSKVHSLKFETKEAL